MVPGDGDSSPDNRTIDDLVIAAFRDRHANLKELANMRADREKMIYRGGHDANMLLEDHHNKEKAIEESLEVSDPEGHLMTKILEMIVKSYWKAKRNLLPLWNHCPLEVWEKYQLQLDDACIQHRVLLHPTRYKSEYAGRCGTIDLLATLGPHKEIDGHRKDLTTRIGVVYMNKASHEYQVGFVNGLDELWANLYNVCCGPRLCGKLAADGETCVHFPGTLQIHHPPVEWEDRKGWVRGNPFEVRHQKPEQGPAWEPFYDYDENGRWKKMRDYDQSLMRQLRYDPKVGIESSTVAL
jgi:hypothetical protein